MADQSDVEAALAALVAATLYPNGTGGASAIGATARIYRGWPNQAALDADLAAGIVNVTVFPDAAHQRNTTRYPNEFVVMAPVAPALTVTCTATQAIFGGSAATGQIAGVLADNVAAVHRTATGDTPAMVASIIAARLATQMTASANGVTVTVPGAWRLIGRVVADQPALAETRRQEQGFRITCWCPDPATRDACAAAIDLALSQTTFLTLPDGSGGRLRYLRSAVFDQSQDAALYRRDLHYAVEYATTAAAALPSMIFGDATLAPAGQGVVQSLLG